MLELSDHCFIYVISLLCCPHVQDTIVLQPLANAALSRTGPGCRRCVRFPCCDFLALRVGVHPTGVYAVTQRQVT